LLRNIGVAAPLSRRIYSVQLGRIQLSLFFDVQGLGGKFDGVTVVRDEATSPSPVGDSKHSIRRQLVSIVYVSFSGRAFVIQA
jgi:hypothetical protein